jgi:hypothetical protein
MTCARKIAATLLVLASAATAGDEPTGRIPVDVRQLPSSAILVTNEAQLRAAARLTESTSINILIDRRIILHEGVTFPTSESIVRIIGVGDDAHIEFAFGFSGDWGDATAKPENGLSLNCRQAVLRGLTFSGYDALGSAIKGETEELLDISDCTFRDIGTKRFAPKVAHPRQSQDAFCNQCIGAHKMAHGHISITNSRFINCIHSSHQWSHVIYCSARSVSILGNRFERCGNPFAVGGKLGVSGINIFGNTVVEPALQPLPSSGREEAAYIAGLHGDFVAFLFNTFQGEFYRPWTGHPRSRLHLIDFNDYSGAVYKGAWAADLDKQEYITFEQWRARGFDNHSRPPREKTNEPQAEQAPDEP